MLDSLVVLQAADAYLFYLNGRNDLIYVREALQRLIEDHDDKLSDKLFEAIEEVSWAIDNIGLYILIPKANSISIDHKLIADIFRKSLCFDAPSFYKRTYQGFYKSRIDLKYYGMDCVGDSIDSNICFYYTTCPAVEFPLKDLNTLKKSGFIKKLYGECFLDSVYSSLEMSKNKISADESYIFFGIDRVQIKQFIAEDLSFKEFNIEISSKLNERIDVDIFSD